MGKALLVIVLGSGLILTKQLYSATEHEGKTARDQAVHQEEAIAREIANSAFNVGMGEIRAYGENVTAGAQALNGAQNSGREGTHTSGRFNGGAYTVRAELTSGHSVRVVATGTYGEAEFTMHDEYRVPVLTAREDGMMTVTLSESLAGFCSAVFYEEYKLDMPEGTVPEPIMLFTPGNRYRTENQKKAGQTIWVEAGTQMNFFIAVDKNCSLLSEVPVSECGVRDYVQTYEYDASDYDYVHYALNVRAGELDQAHEEIWGLVEQHPDDRQRWRVGWEDIHDTSWDVPESDNPLESLQALKMLGYDKIGWPERDADLYRLLRDYSTRPDFSDQTIEVEVIPASAPNFHGKQTSARAKQANCGETIDLPVVEDPPVVTDPEVVEDLEEIEDAIDDGAPVVTPDPDPEPDDLTTFACECTKNNTNDKTPILHRPPGNESNEQYLCLPEPAIDNAHMVNHNDVFPKCQVRQNIKSNNGNGNNK